MTTAQFDPSGLIAAPLTPPPSKSDAHRALTLSALLGQAPRLSSGGKLPNDICVLRDGLARLAGLGPQELDCADAGAPFRILVTQAALRRGESTLLSGTARLGERPHGPLLEALERTLGPVGFAARWGGSPWPLAIRGIQAPAPLARFEVDGSQSSQFATSLLLGAAALHLLEARPWEVVLTGAPTSQGYLEITTRWLSRAGFRLETTGSRVAIVGFEEAQLPPVPGDWSSIGYLALVAWRTGGSVRGVDLEAEHPDRELLRILEQAGLTWTPSREGLTVRGVPSSGISADAARCPDLLPTLAALACVLPGPSRFENVSLLRAKESDRLQGMIDLVELAGGDSSLDGEVLEIHPGSIPPPELRFDARGDHRMAMSAATLAVLLGRPLTLAGAEHVSKSFPGFWDELKHAGSSMTLR